MKDYILCAVLFILILLGCNKPAEFSSTTEQFSKLDLPDSILHTSPHILTAAEERIPANTSEKNIHLPQYILVSGSASKF